MMPPRTITEATLHTPTSDHTSTPPIHPTPLTPPPPSNQSSPPPLPQPPATHTHHSPPSSQPTSESSPTTSTPSPPPLSPNSVPPLTSTKSSTPPSYAYKNVTKTGPSMTKLKASSELLSLAAGLAPKSPLPTAENRPSSKAHTNPAASPR